MSAKNLENLLKQKLKQKKTNPGLQKAGTGDVLAGMCAGYLAQGLSLWSAAKEAVTTGNTIADVLTKKKKGYYFLASDLARELTPLEKGRSSRG